MPWKKCLFFVLVCVTPSLAQQRVKVAGEVSHACMDVARRTQRTLGTFAKTDAPASWTWVVVCDADSWEKLFPTTWDTKVGETQPDTSFTYLNGSRLDLTIPQGFTFEYVIAHELGHIMTHSSSEKDANAWAAQRGYRWGHKNLS